MEGKGEPASTFRRVLAQFLAVTAKNTLAINAGLSIAFPTMVIPALMDENSNLHLTTEQISWMGSLFFIVIPVGCLLSGPCVHRFGRKSVMMAFCIPFSLTWVLCSQAQSAIVLYLAVGAQALIVGFLDSPVLTYVAEICEPEWRGVFATTFILASLLGVSLQFLIGNWVEWRTAAYINIAFPLVSFISLSFVPESPHWLVSRKRIPEAEKGLMWLRGWVDSSVVQTELSQLIESTDSNRKGNGSPFTWAPYLTGTFLKPFGIVVTTFFIGHFGGMSTLQTYAVSIFQDLKSPIGGYSTTAISGFVQLSGALFCMCILPFVGRRLLAITATLASGACLVTLVISDTTGWPAILLLLVSVFLINSCSKVLPWVLIGEVFSPNLRAVASGMASSIGYTMGFLVNKTWFSALNLAGLRGVILSYGVVSVAGAIFYFFCLPETEGRTLDEVQAHFRGEVNLRKTKHGKSAKVVGVDNTAFSEEA